MQQPSNPNRRWFIKSSMASGALLIVSPFSHLNANESMAKQEASWCVYVVIHPDNSVLMSSPVMEMGQHMKTTGPVIIADEMDLDWSLISFSEDCPTYLHRNEENQIGYQHADMGTGGSHAVRRNWQYLREAGAAAKVMLKSAAAEKWTVPITELETQNSFVIHTLTNRKLSYGELAKAASEQIIDLDNVPLKKQSEYHIIGKDTRTVDIQDIITGKPIYSIDADYPDVKQVVIHRAPALGANIKSYDRKKALAVPGVIAIEEMQRIEDKYWSEQNKQSVAAGVAVIAEDLWAATKGKEALNTQWQDHPKYANQNSEQELKMFRELVTGDATAVERQRQGDARSALTESKITLSEIYETPLFAHACMEPFSCIVDIRKSDATVVIGHQFPHMVAEEVEKMTGIDALKVEVISKRMGGGFGRRFEMDFLREGIQLSKKLGYPVKITWTREDTLERDYFAPAYVMKVTAGMNKKGKIKAWHHRQAQTRGGTRDTCFPMHLVQNYLTEHFTELSEIPTGPWRGPAHMQWTFAVESMTDELAHKIGADPLSLRLDMLHPHEAYPYEGWGAEYIDSGRMAKCYKKAAALAEWQRKRPEGHGLGIAGHFTFGSYAAFVIEVSVNDNDELTLHKAWGAIDCGLAINPNHIRNQMEGGFIDGLSAALFNKVNIEKGAVQNTNFHTLRWMKMAEAPIDIEVAIIDNDYPPTGVGEPPTAPAAAALANAIFAACGKRIRTLPIAESISI